MKEEDLKKTNKAFDSMIRDFILSANKCKPVMPLVAQSLELTVELIKTYKEAFNGINKKS